MDREQLFQELLQLEADFCSALSEPTRLLILYTLHESPRTVSELSADLGLPQPNISRHLKVLRERGLVQAIRRGTFVTYKLTDERLIQALDLLRSLMRDRVTHQASIVDSISPLEESV